MLATGDELGGIGHWRHEGEGGRGGCGLAGRGEGRFRWEGG